MTIVLQTFTGRRFDYTSPAVDQISILDIAHGLALQNRFNGHTALPYSVAEHSARVALRVKQLAMDNWIEQRIGSATRPLDAVRVALLHDAGEAYVGDLVRPLKQRADFASFGWLEQRIQRVIHERFDLDKVALDSHELVKRADRELLHTEARDLLPGGPRGWIAAEALPARIEPMPWHQAERWFLLQFAELFPVDQEIGNVRRDLAPAQAAETES